MENTNKINTQDVKIPPEKPYLFSVLLDGILLRATQIGPIQTYQRNTLSIRIEIKVLATKEMRLVGKKYYERKIDKRRIDKKRIVYTGETLHVVNYDLQGESISWVDVEGAKLAAVYEGERDASKMEVAALLFVFTCKSATWKNEPYNEKI